MIRPVRLFVALVLLTGLTACHTDPFGIKPEVRGVEIPDEPAQPAEPAEPAPEVKQ